MVYFSDVYNSKYNSDSDLNLVKNIWNIIENKNISNSNYTSNDDEFIETFESISGFQKIVPKYDISYKLSKILDYQDKLKNKMILEDIIVELEKERLANLENQKLSKYKSKWLSNYKNENCITYTNVRYIPLCEGGLNCEHEFTYKYDGKEKSYECPKCLIVKSFKCNCSDCKPNNTNSIDCFSFYKSRINLDKKKWTKFVDQYYSYYYKKISNKSKMEYYTEEIEKNKIKKEEKIKEQIKEFEENRYSFLRDMDEIKKYKNIDERKYNTEINLLKRVYEGNEYVLDNIEDHINYY